MVYLFLITLLGWSLLVPKRELRPFDVHTPLPLRGLLAMLIVCIHCAPQFKYSSSSELIQLICTFLYAAIAPTVTVFFFLTGYGLAKSIRKKGSSYLDRFLFKRLSSVLPELIIISALAVGTSMVLGIIDSLSTVASDMAKGRAPIQVSWFMYVICYIYIAFYASFRLSRGNRIAGSILFSLFTLLCTFIPYKLNWEGCWYASTMAVVIGYWISLYEDKLELFITNPLTILIFIAFWCFCNTSSFYALTILGNCLCAVAVYIAIRRFGFPQSKALIFLGEISLNIYLIHSLFINFAVICGLHRYIILTATIALSIASAFIMKQIRTAVQKLISKPRIATAN